MQIKRLENYNDGSVYWILYEKGSIKKPLRMLTHIEATILLTQIVTQIPKHEYDIITEKVEGKKEGNKDV